MHTESSDAVLTFDVEDWEHANYPELESRPEAVRESVKARAYRMDRNVETWIETLRAGNSTSTCFVLGEFAERYPHAVKKLHAAGHEIASHNHDHRLVHRLTQAEFRESLKRSLGVLGDLVGKRPRGFRAPSWSADARTPWFCDELRAAGIDYDSSAFPVKTPLFGDPRANVRAWRENGLLRIPASVIELGGARLPFSSGAFFRLAPLNVIRWGLAQAKNGGRPVMVVLHPRELDPDHPRLPLAGWKRWIHYANLGSTLPKLEAILPLYRWRAIEEVYRDQLVELSRST